MPHMSIESWPDRKYVMSKPMPALLPHIRRVITSHNASGVAIAGNNTLVPSEAMDIVPGARGATMWVVEDGLPTAENVGELCADSTQRRVHNPENFDLVPPCGANLRSTELAPGASTAMHRTSSLDYNILVAGELVLITADGAETRLSTPGDTVVQRGTLHAWRNPSATQWTRWVSVLLAAEPAIAGGATLPPVFIDAVEEVSVPTSAPAAVAARNVRARPGDRAQTPSEVGA
ncbi:hypothetical protein HYPSUDRAFT_522077 [Hypholoma sublateritium FD-334 SS-4]|uniref:Cupin 2 conserved barrel domain-containing protein n=1 Tax=Hypholoma sublateritium (strain FD-334 SS-4) TaxID=945553 RepID=A0A0D2PFD7_HYPSF|nr:hypothetical protein HYPSUDRAFT_522077 [Hypholoma sublateritium FD-334 SS-4]